MPINTGIISDKATSGMTMSELDRANAKLAIGITMKLPAMPATHTQPTAGRQPATNMFLCAASTLLTSSWPFASSCACFSAIVEIWKAIAFLASLSSINLSSSPVTGPISELKILIYYPSIQPHYRRFITTPRAVINMDKDTVYSNASKSHLDSFLNNRVPLLCRTNFNV